MSSARRSCGCSRRAAGISVAITSLLLGSVGVCADDVRGLYSAEDVAAMESVVGAAYPGAPVAWGASLAVSLGGQLVPVELPGYKRFNEAGRARVVSGLEHPQRIEAAVEELKRTGRVSQAVTSRLVALELQGGQVVSSHSAVLDAGAAVTEILTVAPGATSTDWLQAELSYVGMYEGGSGEWIGSIEWAAQFDLLGGAVLQRLPLRMWLRLNTGEEQEADVGVERTPSGLVVHVGARTVSVACGAACVVQTADVFGR